MKGRELRGRHAPDRGPGARTPCRCCRELLQPEVLPRASLRRRPALGPASFCRRGVSSSCAGLRPQPAAGLDLPSSRRPAELRAPAAPAARLCPAALRGPRSPGPAPPGPAELRTSAPASSALSLLWCCRGFRSTGKRVVRSSLGRSERLQYCLLVRSISSFLCSLHPKLCSLMLLLLTSRWVYHPSKCRVVMARQRQLQGALGVDCVHRSALCYWK